MSKYILVVDDNLDTRTLLHLHLKWEGFTVYLASDGSEGLYLARQERPDLIITDVTMPIMDGIELTRQIRKDPELRDIPILVLTAFGPKVIKEAIEAGASRAMEKPPLLDTLIADVKALLEIQNKI